MVGLFQHFKVYHHIAGKEYPVLHAVLLQLVILQTVKRSIHIVLCSFHTAYKACISTGTGAAVMVSMQA